MKRMGTGLVVLALVTACGGGSDDKPEVTATTPAPKIELADACPKIQDALDSSFDQGGIGSITEYRAFGSAITTLKKQVDPKGVPLLTSLAEASETAAQNLETDPLAGDWLAAMRRVSDTCQQLGAPLS